MSITFWLDFFVVFETFQSKQNNPSKKKEFGYYNSDAKILCQPPILLEDINTKGLSPDILVAGDIISKKYDFMMGDLDNNPYKIAQVRLMMYHIKQ